MYRFLDSQNQAGSPDQSIIDQISFKRDIIDKLLQDKLEEARQNGISEGQQLALFEMAKAMSANGCDIDLISRVTGLSIADIKQVLDWKYGNTR